MMTRDEWIGLIQDFLEERMKDAPDKSCHELAGNLWLDLAEADLPEGRSDWGMNRDC